MNINNCKIELIPNSIKILNISDEEYFSEKYSNHISNSKLKLINPKEGGSPELFFSEEKQDYNKSLEYGTALHNLILQSKEFKLLNYKDKPNAKLGIFIDNLVKYRKQKYKIIDAIEKASEDANYYKNKITKKLFRKSLEKGLKYYFDLYYDKLKSTDEKENIIVSCDILEQLQDSLKCYYGCKQIRNYIESDNSFNEQAIFSEFKVTLENNEECILPFKLKIDNYVIDEINKTITLNDLKTTSKPIDYFMGYKFYDELFEEYKGYLGSFHKMHYYRQLAIYIYILQQIYKEKYIYNTNIIVAGPKPDYGFALIPIQNAYIEKGILEFKELMFRVAFHTLYGKDARF